MNQEKWTLSSAGKVEVYGMVAVPVVASVLLVEAICWLVNPFPYWSPHAPRAVIWGMAVLGLLGIVTAIWKLTHMATWIKFTDGTIDMGFGFVFHRVVSDRDVTIRLVPSKWGQPEFFRISFRGGYVDVPPTWYKRSLDLAKRLKALLAG